MYSAMRSLRAVRSRLVMGARCPVRVVLSSKAAPVSPDVPIKEPFSEINPHLYIFGRLASVTSKTVGVIQKDITYVYHYYHKEDLATMLNNFDQTINFKGHELDYCIAEREYSSYMVNDCDNIEDMSNWKRIGPGNATPLTGIKLLHFATRSSQYGDREYKIPFDVIITRYLQTRRHFSKEKDKINSVVYRVACTQIRQKEINHMVIINCDGDHDILKDLPILGPTFRTKHFTPKEESTPRGTRYSAKMLQHTYRDQLYENLTLSLYLPDDCQLQLSKEDYTLKEVHKNLIMKLCSYVIRSFVNMIRNPRTYMDIALMFFF